MTDDQMVRYMEQVYNSDVSKISSLGLLRLHMPLPAAALTLVRFYRALMLTPCLTSEVLV
jgi:hypothetical protein